MAPKKGKVVKELLTKKDDDSLKADPIKSPTMVLVKKPAASQASMSKEGLQAHDEHNPALAKLEKMQLLDEKMVEFKNSNGNINRFNYDDHKKLYGRLRSALSSEREAFQLMESVERSGRGKDAKKKALLYAWIKDPSFGSAFWTMVQGVELNNKVQKEAKWATKKELSDKYGDELEEMLAANAFPRKRTPVNNKFWLYLDNHDSSIMEVNKFKTYAASQSQTLDKDQAPALMEAFETLDCLDDDDAFLGANEDWQDGNKD